MLVVHLSHVLPESLCLYLVSLLLLLQAGLEVVHRNLELVVPCLKLLYLLACCIYLLGGEEWMYIYIFFYYCSSNTRPGAYLPYTPNIKNEEGGSA